MARDRSRRAYLLALSALTVGVAGCRSQGDGATPQTTTQASTEPSATQGDPEPSETPTAEPTATPVPEAALEVHPNAMSAERVRQFSPQAPDFWQFLDVPASATKAAYAVQSPFGNLVDWYDDNTDHWTETDAYHISDEYDVPYTSRYGYRRLEHDDAGGFVFYKAQEMGSFGKTAILLLVVGAPSTIANVSVNPPVFAARSTDLPRFVTAQPTDLGHVTDVSYFRSGYGHSYTGDFETCRSMKHYFGTAGGSNDIHEPQYAPVSGTIFRWEEEGGPSDVMMTIRPDGHPAFGVEMFHVDPAAGLQRGTHVDAGQKLGAMAEDTWTASEPSVIAFTPQGKTYVSLFAVMTDDAFAEYTQYGISAREELILAEEYRDANPISCEQDGHGTGPFTEQIGDRGLSDVNFVELEH